MNPFLFALLVIFAFLFGFLNRCAYNIRPINKYILLSWVIVNIWGYVITPFLGIFFFMSVVTIGWFSYYVIVKA